MGLKSVLYGNLDWTVGGKLHMINPEHCPSKPFCAFPEGPSTQYLGPWVLGNRNYSTGFG